MATYAELLAQAKTLMNQAEELRRSEKTEALALIRAQMKEFGITISDLGGDRKYKAKTDAGKSDRPARFKGPEGQLWSGLGRYPDWLREAVASGKAKDDFMI